MSSSIDLSGGISPIQQTNWIDEAQCGKLGFTIVTVNTVASAIFLTNLAIYGTLLGAVSLTCTAIILPSIALFGVKNYFSYLPKPLQMGLGFAAAWATVTVDAKTGIWKGNFAEWAHFYDGRLSQGLQTFFSAQQATSIIDLGCGTGDYVKDLRKVGLDCEGCDGNPDTKKLAGTYCYTVDLTKPNAIKKQFEWVLSLEVGEHLPKDHEAIFLDNVTQTARAGIVLSWAKKGQGGLGHVNEQNNDYIENQMLQRGWVRDKKAEEALRLQTSPHCFWYRDTLMVYRPKPN